MEHKLEQKEEIKIKLDQILPFYKPIGITSATLTNKIKKKLKKYYGKKIKVGHGGTLDKDAEGLMIVGVGKGTKLLGNHLKGNKVYQAVGVLGIETETYGKSKIVEEMKYDHINIDMLNKVIKKFIGKIKQIPPLYSALKIKGKRASDLAREGKKIDMKFKEREIDIYNIELIDFSLPKFTIKVKCGGGTYIRSLIHDIGKELQCCAYMDSLIRLEQGKFKLHDAIKI